MRRRILIVGIFIRIPFGSRLVALIPVTLVLHQSDRTVVGTMAACEVIHQREGYDADEDNRRLLIPVSLVAPCHSSPDPAHTQFISSSVGLGTDGMTTNASANKPYNSAMTLIARPNLPSDHLRSGSGGP
jgi:hypothetical protein